ncbi:DUF397 domain-containing protein [Streptomyces cinnamoneus]|uniref:DUF397 domain-containing protein n=1 Tax=Streptomyces cinnamoneus TaxID=53446 RepID=A0A2G1X9X1_STRCJ|nr:DUF397 domain-containing protein [Streptomyces cinnamoneus]PHQ47969.1 DUF397 domain-containing protein [Streptomyces cinnamoneus]PPT15593.1 DUF397 domain-containing protein [Streptomyces cinnamoneus]
MSTTPGLIRADWRTSSYSDGTGGNCVEVADTIADTIWVRDSKNPDGPALTFPPQAWASFIRTL